MNLDFHKERSPSEMAFAYPEKFYWTNFLSHLWSGITMTKCIFPIFDLVCSIGVEGLFKFGANKTNLLKCIDFLGLNRNPRLKTIVSPKNSSGNFFSLSIICFCVQAHPQIAILLQAYVLRICVFLALR